MTMPTELSNFFLAMQAGKPGAERLEACFADDAVYEEPFSGTPTTHEGKAAIMAAMSRGWEPQPMPDMHIRLDHAQTSGNEIHVRWTCFSPAIPGGSGHGLNRFEMRDGLIVRLITTLEGTG